MVPDRTLVVIGAGLAGAKAAEAARAADFDGAVVVVGDEQEAPYERPPLSKEVLRGEAAPETSRVHDDAFYKSHEIDVRTGRRVASLDVGARHVRLEDGEEIPFGTAVLTTGAAVRRLGVPGASLDGVHYLRTLGDARRLGDAIRGARRVAVIGAGWIGSEVAASARQMGADVVLVEPAPVPLQRVLGDELGEVFRALHADNGVHLRLGVGVAELRGGASGVSHVVLGNGDVEEADVVVIGVGVVPRVELAVDAGLAVADGVVVDDQLRSSAPGVYAAGDVASAWHPRYQRHLRVEHWSNAIEQGSAAGRNATGSLESYTHLPYFFSDQYDLGMEYVGHSDPGDAVVVRGNLADREFVAFWHRDGRLTAAMHVNVWDVIDDLRRLVSGTGTVDLARLGDPGVPLAELAAASNLS